MIEDLDRFRAEVTKRRTFAIISHPDAGKTTLTEKLLLYGGAIHLAGSVKGREGSRQTTSDWMKLEQERGISISSSALQFTYGACHVNLLDTPGHNDFSEDTYRTLSAADCAVLLIDSVKGVEPQTIKLFQVCRMRNIPILTFMNKMDRDGREPLDLMDEIERILGIPCSPINWPVGQGAQFRGVYDRVAEEFYLFERAESKGMRAEMTRHKKDDADLVSLIGEKNQAKLIEDLSLLDVAGNTFDREQFLAGQVTPVFFGSAMSNFGVEPFLDRFVELAPPPRPRPTADGSHAADSPNFSGFVFKIQANMDPRHRDRVAYMRICSGKFQRGMEVVHVQSGKTIALTKPLQLIAQERTQIDEAYSGDIIGLYDVGVLHIGDTLCEGPSLVEFQGVPRFSPEHFVRVRLTDPLKRKQLKKGLDQLSEEGVVQMFFDRQRMERDPILGAVGVLQFEVIQYRLKEEYGASVEFDRLKYKHARWVEGENIPFDKLERPGYTTCVLDVEGRPLVLFESDWALRMALEDHPKLNFIAAVQPGRAATKTA